MNKNNGQLSPGPRLPGRQGCQMWLLRGLQQDHPTCSTPNGSPEVFFKPIAPF